MEQALKLDDNHCSLNWCGLLFICWGIGLHGRNICFLIDSVNFGQIYTDCLKGSVLKTHTTRLCCFSALEEFALWKYFSYFGRPKASLSSAELRAMPQVKGKLQWIYGPHENRQMSGACSTKDYWVSQITSQSKTQTIRVHWVGWALRLWVVTLVSPTAIPPQIWYMEFYRAVIQLSPYSQ